MNNLSSYCGLLDAKIRSSDKDLPIQTYQTYPNMELMPALSPYGLQYSPTEHL